MGNRIVLCDTSPTMLLYGKLFREMFFPTVENFTPKYCFLLISLVQNVTYKKI